MTFARGGLCRPMRDEMKTGGLGDVSQRCRRRCAPPRVEVMEAFSQASGVVESFPSRKGGLEVPLLGCDCRLLRADPLIVIDCCRGSTARDGGPYQAPTTRLEDTRCARRSRAQPRFSEASHAARLASRRPCMP